MKPKPVVLEKANLSCERKASARLKYKITKIARPLRAPKKSNVDLLTFEGDFVNIKTQTVVKTTNPRESTRASVRARVRRYPTQLTVLEELIELFRRQQRKTQFEETPVSAQLLGFTDEMR
jgi:hypothetical protein